MGGLHSDCRLAALQLLGDLRNGDPLLKERDHLLKVSL